MESLSQRAWRLRVRDAVTDPWTLLLCLVGGGVAWAIGVPWMLPLVVSCRHVGCGGCRGRVPGKAADRGP